MYADDPKPQVQQLEEVNLANEGEDPKHLFVWRPLRISTHSFLELLKEYSDDFAWTQTEISLDPEISTKTQCPTSSPTSMVGHPTLQAC